MLPRPRPTLPTAFPPHPTAQYRVFSAQMYPMSMTDMRLIDSKISPTWCQRQVVKSNATFNAFVLPGAPELSQELVPVSMTRELELEDDMKEYWGFYLLKGSTVTVSACVRWPGASLIMIKGYKHLQECAYIGDNSSEELDELLEANKLGLLSNTSLLEKIQELKKVDGKANDPGTMTRHKAGVSFHDPRHTANVTSSESVPAYDVTDHDPKELREILERFHALRQAAKTESFKHYKPPPHLMSLPALHRHRDTNVDRDERRWLSFKDIDGNISVQVSNKIETVTTTARNEEVSINEYSKAQLTTDKTKESDINEDSMSTKAPESKESDINIAPLSKESSEDHETITQSTNIVTTEKSFLGVDNKIEVETGKDLKDDTANTIIERTPSTQADPNSREVFEDVLHKLEALGPRGTRVLQRLHETMGVKYPEHDNKSDIMSAVTGSEEELDRLRKVLVEAIDEEKTRSQRQQKRRDAREEARVKRELMLGQIELTKQLNEDDDARDFAAEEGLEPDGYAEDHKNINETTAFDMSNSEFWSSFSSSEEALLECEGLILNLPLTPHTSCTKESDETHSLAASKANALTYRVPANGYYFFVFNSENEVQTNFIRAKFEMQKTRYEVAKTALRECKNSTDRCDLLLDIFTSQKVVLEVPLRANESLWNEQFVILSECEPRTSIYLVCVIAVPLLIMIFAFQ
ncbi:uncharacterized protein isoform X2 [Choristoneura fumiferana]|uniref:uncharacterized protein isoform X2 n=2 Tax=Choristoneura fumiferana TaxID=7141 RepID=UPI003D153D1B